MILIILSRARAHRRIRKDEFINGMNKKTIGNGHNRKISVTFAVDYLHGDLLNSIGCSCREIIAPLFYTNHNHFR